MIDHEKLRAIAARALRDAEQRRQSAGYSGALDDGGSGRIKDIVEAFLAGLESRLPESLREYEKLHVRETDPEYPAYLRLQKKFGQS